MTIIDKFLKFVEDLFTSHAQEIVAAATSPQAQAIEAAAAGAAIQSATQDPKVAAGIAVYQAVKNYNAVASDTVPVAPPGGTMSVMVDFYVVVGCNDLDGVFVMAIFKDWNKAAMFIGKNENCRIRKVTTLEESM